MKSTFLCSAGVVLGLALRCAAAETRPTTAPATQPVRLLDAKIVAHIGAISPLLHTAEAKAARAAARRDHAARLSGEPNAEERVLLALACANWELAEAAAPAATRWLLGVREAADLALFRESADAAIRHLDAAEKDLASLEESTERAVQRQRARWTETLETLRHFAAAYQALAGAVPGEGSELAAAQAACRDAALDLAELRESEDPDTASAAKLWQCVLLEAGGRADRALAALELALAAPVQFPFDFYQRVLRCELLTARGSFALTEGLALRMIRLCDQWFSRDAAEAAAAKATLTAMRAVSLRKWAESLAAADAEQSRRLSDRADAIVREQFAAKAAALYSLDRAIPLFVEMPSAQTAPATQSRPATRTTEPAVTQQPSSVPASNTE